MNAKLQYYCDVSEQAAKEATAGRGNWINFLDTAAKMYKYSFSDQLMIHVQKPDAIACAPIEMWNKSFSRWVRRGTKGIALIDETGTRPKLKYVFDVSDTEVFRENTPNVTLWELKEEHKPLVLDGLAKIYDDVSDSVSDTFRNIASQLAAEYYSDNTREIYFRSENSFLEGFDEDNLRTAFIEAVSASIAYILMARCGFETEDYFTEEDFEHITGFNTPDMIHTLGEATSDLSEQVLRDVELVIKKYERKKSNELNHTLHNERNVENERTSERNPEHALPDHSGEIGNDLHTSGRLSPAEHGTDGRAGGQTVGQIRHDEEVLSETAPQDNLRIDEQPGNTLSSLPGNGGIGGSEIGTGNERLNSESEPPQQGSRPDGLDSGDEHTENPSRRNDTPRTDLRRHLEDNQSLSQVEDMQELLLPTPSLSETLSTSSVTLDEVDFILRDGSNSRNSALRISAHYAKNLPLETNALYLQEEYLKGRYKNHNPSDGGKGFQFGNTETALWFDKTGIKIGRGKSAVFAKDFVHITWEQAAERIKQLYDTGQYVNHDVLEEALHNEHIENAESLLNLYRDDFRDFHMVPESWGWAKKGWPETVTTITELLKDHSEYGEYHIILEGLREDVAVLKADPNAPTRFWHDPYRTLDDLEKLAIDPKGFPAANTQNINAFRFITDDEVNKYFTRGSSFSESKLRILSHFLHNHTTKENIDFLKNEYGHGGGSWSNIDDGWHDANPTSGITLKRTGCENVNLKWDKAQKRIAELVKTGRYMTIEELERVPHYEKMILARQIQNFFYALPEEQQQHSPFEKELDFYYPHEAEWNAIGLFTEDTDQINACLEKMQYILENTATDDRYYNSRKGAFENLTAFHNGTYTLFPNIDRFLITKNTNRPPSQSIPAPESAFSKPTPIQQMSLFESAIFPKLPNVEEQRIVLEQANTPPTITHQEPLFLEEETEVSQKSEIPEELETVQETEETGEVKFPPPEILHEPQQTIPLEEPSAKPDFETVSAQILMRVMENADYKNALAAAESRASLRNPCTLALEQTIHDHKNDEPEIFHAYFYDDDFNDRLFDYVLRQSWENRTVELLPEQETSSAYASEWEKYIDEIKHNAADYTEPFVVIADSESLHFTDYERMNFAEADAKFKEVETIERTERIEQGRYGGYHKTTGTIFYKDNPDDTILSTYSFRYDIGDYSEKDSGLYNHIRGFWQNVQNGINSNEYTSFTQEDVENIQRMLDILEESLETEKNVVPNIPESPKTEPSATLPAPLPAGMPITKSIVDTFSKEMDLFYAVAEDGSLYISNRFYIIKTSEKDINALTEKLNKRRRKYPISAVENQKILEHIKAANGNFELTQDPYEIVTNKYSACIYSDNKQYFQYNKRFVDVFRSKDNRLFVDDHSSLDVHSHSLVIKDKNSGVLGFVLPVAVNETLYEQLADILPLEIPWKNEIERARENADNDPYIGREFNAGNNTYFISGITKHNGMDMYKAPTITDGKLSGSAMLIAPADMENQIARWETSRTNTEEQQAANEVREQEKAAARAEYEDTNGYADNFPPMQKANVLKVLNDTFATKDYGRLNVKQLIETALKNGKTLEIAKPMKKKYREMDGNGYLHELGNRRDEIEARSNYVKASQSYDIDSSNAHWLKENHPFLHYEIFSDESVLGDSYFNTEYRLIVGENTFYEISKTAYDYGIYLAELLPQQAETELESAAKILETASKTVTLTKPPNFRITDNNLGTGGAKTKFKANMEAIKTLQTIETENRFATAEEQEILSRYVGWGGLQEAFDPSKEQWTKEYAELLNILSPVEYESAKESVLNAHYTSPTVIKSIYETVERLGFKTGNVLEPSMGVGNFFGLLPESMGSSKLYGVEIDSISARIAKQLYPNATIKEMGFEKTDYPDSFFDIAIGNVPFGSYSVADKKYDKYKLPIHDYFLTKTLDQVRPGGIVAFVTSKGTLDKQNPDMRKYLAQRAELLGAVRLPNTAFKANAGTEVTSDIIFLQKRDRIIDIEPDWVHLGQVPDANNPEKSISVNRYFADNPEMILGTMSTDSGTRMYGSENSTSCIPIEGADLSEQLRTALFNVTGQITEPEIDDLDGTSSEIIPADPDVKNFSFTVIDDKVYFRENSMMYPVEQPATTLERIKGMIGLRDCVRELINLQVDESGEYFGEKGDEAIQAKQAELNTLYDRFTAQYGLINSTANNRAFATGQFSDNAYYLLCSLEILNEDGNLERKGDMFSKRTIKQKTSVTHVDTASEALAVSMGEKARIDIEFMSRLTGKDEETLFNELQGVIYKDFYGFPDGHYTYVTADEFLSGNIRNKLAKYQKGLEYTGENHPNYATVKHHAEALEKAMPKELEAHEINLRLGSTWIDPQYVQQFMYELLNTSWHNQQYYQVRYHAPSGEWQVLGKGRSIYSDISATVTYGTSRANAYQIIDDTLNLRDVRIYDYKQDADGKEQRILNKKETTLAQQKQEQIKQAFKEWIFKNPERRQMLVKLYNEKFNSTRPREYDGSHITFSGISPEITLRKHQLNAIAHILYGGNTLLAHEVGAGKTFEIVAAAMESKRLGLCNKSLIAVPNHLTEQWASEFLRLYPSANILVATKKDFEMRNRRKFIAKIATGEYDAVIIGHTQLEKIPLSKERQQRLLQEQIDEIEDGIRELDESKGDRFTIKQMMKTKKSLETRIQKLMDGKTRDNVVTFEELGVDRLYVDESHNFKNLMLYSKMRNVAGLSTTDAQKSTDLFMKTRYMDELTGNKGVIFATGTPISNSISEMYTIQRYLQYDLLMEKDFTHFDAWASTFCEPETSIELSPEGTGYRARTRLATFHNLPELMNMFKEVADIQTADMLNLPVPKANYETIVAEPSDLQQEMVQELSKRATAVQRKMVDARVDNMLKITTDGRKIGLDQRLINAMLPDAPGSKVNACTENVLRIWQETREDRLTQLVFCDFSTPNKDGRFNVYEDIRSKLIESGIPEHEISFIHDANTESQKKELFAKVRQGKVRILFGSTAKMGAGTNCQDRLIAVHDVDCPWRPADLAQRAGRIVRQGNKNKEVQIYRYATSKTFDSYLWQTVEAKQKFISQIMTSKSPVRSCEDVDETALSYAEIKALCAGNPLIAKKMNLDIEVAKLRMLKADYQSQHYRLEDDLLKEYPKEIAEVKERIIGFESDIKLYEKYNTEPVAIQLTDGAASVTAKFSGMIINGITYTEKEPAAKALLTACKDIQSTDKVSIGEYMGFDMSLQFDSFHKSFRLSLKGSMTHSVDLGTDSFGNITRINNTLASLPQKLESSKNILEELNSQKQAIKEELAKPFHLADELAEKELLLAEINSQLNLDGEKESEEITGTDIVSDKAVLPEMNRAEFIESIHEFNRGNQTDFSSRSASQKDEEIAI